MSDEDRDVDIESDEEEESASTASTQFMTQAEKRAHHNALERKRRDHIKESFLSLRDSVPTLHGEKVAHQVPGQPNKRTSPSIKSTGNNASRAQILKQATDYIQLMSRKNHHHQQDIEDLKRQNGQLESQVRALEKAKAAGNYLNGETGSNSSSSRIAATYNGGSDSASSSESEPEEQPIPPRKKLKT